MLTARDREVQLYDALEVSKACAVGLRIGSVSGICS